MVEVHKFGGASLKDAESVQRMARICHTYIKSGVIVVSAMGKTTNLLEELAANYFKQSGAAEKLEAFASNHNQILTGLFPVEHPVYTKFNGLVTLLNQKLQQLPGLSFDYEYDQIVPFGELASSLIVSEYLNYLGYANQLVDIRPVIRTDTCYREATINWEQSTPFVRQAFSITQAKVYITQGFIGSDIHNQSTTLGREGSDYTASALGSMMGAQKVVVWKDVAGFLSADPSWLPNYELLPRVSYHEAIELSFFGAKIIHPKTIKPLQNHQIPLQIKSFLNPESAGTLIGDDAYYKLPPLYIRKQHQTLISITPSDYSFIMEQNMSDIFGILAKHQIKVNLMQSSAISFSVCTDGDDAKMKQAISALKNRYQVKYNSNLTLITIRHYTPESETKVLGQCPVLVEQRSRTVARFVIAQAND